jgi:hypothetical protein
MWPENNMLYQPGAFGGMQVRILDAQKQARTACDVQGPWVRPKVPSKRTGRKGTRRMWKRANPPHHVMFYREPTDVLVLQGRFIIATPLQADALRRATPRVMGREQPRG